MGIYRWNLPHVRQVKPEQFRIRNIGAALRFLDIVNQEFAEQAVRISFLNECEGISGLVGRVLMVTVHTDKNTSRLVGIEKKDFPFGFSCPYFYNLGWVFLFFFTSCFLFKAFSMTVFTLNTCLFAGGSLENTIRVKSPFIHA